MTTHQNKSEILNINFKQIIMYLNYYVILKKNCLFNAFEEFYLYLLVLLVDITSWNEQPTQFEFPLNSKFGTECCRLLMQI